MNNLLSISEGKITRNKDLLMVAFGIFALILLILSVLWLGGKFGITGFTTRDTIHPDATHLAYKNIEMADVASAMSGTSTQYTSAENTNASTSDNTYVTLNPVADSKLWHSHHFTFDLSSYNINNILNITYTFEGKHIGTWKTIPYVVYYTDSGWTQPSPAQILTTSDQTFTKSFTSNIGNYIDGSNLFHLSVVGRDDQDGNEIYVDYIKLEVKTNDLPVVTALNYPTNNLWVNSVPIDFNFTVEDDTGFTNCTLYGNWSSGWHANTTIININNGTISNITIPSIADGTYIWNVLCYDNATAPQSDWFDSNYTVNINATYPSIQFVAPTTEAGSFSQNYIQSNASVSDNDLDAIIIYLYNSTGLFQSNSSSTSPLSIDFTSLADGTYYLNATANDSGGNINQTETRTIILDTTPLPSSSSSSSGGGGSSCVYKWNCTDWGKCFPRGKQTRDCFNIGSCSDNYKTPETEQNCTYVASEEPLFDVIISLLPGSEEIFQDIKQIPLQINLIKFGLPNELTKVKVNYLVYSENETIHEESEDLEVQKEISFVKTLELPEMDLGTHQVDVKIKYEKGKTAEGKTSFIVKEKLKEGFEFLKTKKSKIYFWAISSVFTMFIAVIIFKKLKKAGF
ncbi:MAG: hypothetical protein ABIA78_00260 [archaeon]